MTQKRLIGILNRMLDLGLLAGFFVVLLLGLYFTCDLVHVYKGVKTDRVMQFRPADDEPARLKELSADCIGWLTIDGTDIDYPVMQGRDNCEYLNKDPWGNYSLTGSIFLDARNAGDFSDPYLLIYGHHMDGGAMFGALDAFADPAYFSEHRRGRLTTDGETYAFELFAYLETDTKDRPVFSPTEGKGPRESIAGKAAINYGILEEGRILGLSTCTSPLSARRICVFGMLKQETRMEGSS